MPRWLERVGEWVEETLPGLLMLAMVVLVCIAVTMRYVFGRPLLFANEVALVLFVWQVMLAAAGGARRHLHLGIEFVTNRLPTRPRAAVDLFGSLAVLALAVGLVILGMEFTLAGRRTLQILGISWRWVYLAVPVGFALMAAHVLADLFRATVGLVQGTYKPPTSALAQYSALAADVDTASRQEGSSQ